MADEVKYKVAEDFKATVSLPSGKEVVIDTMKITTSDWKTLTNRETQSDEEYRIISKATGLTDKDLSDLPMPDYRVLVDVFLKVITQPLSNPT